ncbi:ABC transporter permease [Paenibacillus sp. SYP-B3998]|uniref:ABC transporter permease n=2 Tax=Paenibacillus sp. SYP-B3998 TaxID=2678564 RepID=A0A6G4A522_9BACL|nr:ABC transporter permease [Paenibacillus sp. SYP-B3998]NEW09388.1 ABC transporter permease [Paenibacillus sp. SYP-B3998]
MPLRNTNTIHDPNGHHRISNIYEKMLRNSLYKVLLFFSGLPVNLIVTLIYFIRKKSDPYLQIREETIHGYRQEGYEARLTEEISKELTSKYLFFNKQVNEKKLQRETGKLVEKVFLEEVATKVEEIMRVAKISRVTYGSTFRVLISNPLFFIVSLIPCLLMYLLIYIYSKPYLKYVFDRLVMMVFVIFGVTFLVFTILYLSPLDPASNILGQTATPDQLSQFKQVYGLDQPYLIQLWNAFKGLITFDLGKSFAGNEMVSTEIVRKLPITLKLTVISLIIGILMAIPAGLISATRQYSFFDYSFMLLVLIGLSIPDFWQGLVSILNFSIKVNWLPATYNPDNWLSLINPAIVLGTGLAASVARMTRSSTLEVIHQDYIVTARAKGLSERKVVLKHALGNALIPIVTVIGLQFGGMLGGAAVVEKVFNINGIGSYIVDKQFVPDIPGILAGVIYVAVTISLVNLLVDLLYAFLDPRIRSKMRDY